MHDDGTGEILEAQLVKETTAPFPVAFYRVDHGNHDHSEGQERPQAHTFGNGTGHNRHGRGCEHGLEDEVSHAGVVRRVVTASDHCRSGVVVAQQEGDARNVGVYCFCRVHDVVTNGQVRDTGDAVEQGILVQNFNGVLAAHQAGFEHGKTSGHPHHQCSTHQEIEGIERITELKCHGIHRQFSLFRIYLSEN